MKPACIAILSATVALTGFVDNVAAQSCNSLSSYVEDARDYLRKAQRDSNLNSAKEYARRAKGELEDAETAANSCRCGNAASDFDDAARHARRARDASSSEEFADELRRSVRDFNSALDNLKGCVRRR